MANRQTSLTDALQRELPAVDPAPTARRPDRRNKRTLATWHDADALRAFKMLLLQQDLTLQAGVTEALNDYMQKHGKPRLF